MRIAIVDDGEIDRNELHTKIMEYMEYNSLEFEVYEYKNAESFLAEFVPDYFQLVFMDIYMEEINGMDAAKNVYEKDKNCKIVFLTTAGEYSQMSYSVRAVYYLIKPIKNDEFIQAMEFCEFKPKYVAPTLNITCQGLSIELDTEKIHYIDVHGRNARVHLKNESITIDENFTKTTEKLKGDNRFLICIRGLMVNMQHIIAQEDDWFVLDNGEYLPINIRNRKVIAKTYRSYIYECIGGQNENH